MGSWLDARSVLTVLLLGMLACASGRGDRPPSRDEDALLALEARMFRALQGRDQTALAELLTDDFIFRGPGGVELGKAEFLKNVTAIPGTMLAVEAEHLKAHVFGEVGVLSGVQRARVRLEDGSEVDDLQAFTDVCLKQGGHWRIVLAHSVPAGAR
jgi:uncharacterized protein (TIGR02246 family)